jgi:hypothetical protein
MNLDSFLEKCKIKHGNNFDYSKVSSLNDKIIITCKIHGDFTQLPKKHLISKYGCLKCRDDKFRYHIDDLKIKINKIHNNIYEYPDFNIYINNKQKINIKCAQHGLFSMKIDTHLTGKGCAKCSKIKFFKKQLDKFITKSNAVHNHIYDYSKIKNYGTGKKILIICKTHGKFKQIAWQHLKGSKCPKCVKENRRLTFDEFLMQAKSVHGDKYDYTQASFKYVSDKIKILCNKHGSFIQRVGPHLYAKQGCPNCSKIISKSETEWLNYINLPIKFRNNKVIINEKVFFPDGFDPSTNTFYEYYGDYWHGNLKVYDPNKINKISKMTFAELYDRTIERENFIKSNGYKIISIWESDWNKIKKELTHE